MEHSPHIQFLIDEIVRTVDFRKRPRLGEGDVRKLGNPIIRRKMALQYREHSRRIYFLLVLGLTARAFGQAVYWFLDVRVGKAAAADSQRSIQAEPPDE